MGGSIKETNIRGPLGPRENPLKNGLLLTCFGTSPQRDHVQLLLDPWVQLEPMYYSRHVILKMRPAGLDKETPLKASLRVPSSQDQISSECHMSGFCSEGHMSDYK